MHSSIFIIANLIPNLICIIWGLFAPISGPSHCCKMGNGKNKKKGASRNPRGEKANLVGVSTPKQKPNYPHTRSVTRIQHPHYTFLAATTVPDDAEPQEAVSTPTHLPDVTIFGPTRLQDVQGTHSISNLHHNTHHQSSAVAQTPHEHAEMEIILDDSDEDMSVEPSGSIWIPKVNKVVGGDPEEDESVIFAQTPQVCTFQLNASSVRELHAIGHAPVPVKKLNRAQAKKRVAIEEVVEEEVLEGSSELNAQSMTML